MRRTVSVVTFGALLIASCGGAGGLEVSDVRMGQPTGPNAAVYLTVTSDTADTLLGAATEIADSVQIHETTTADDGTMGMQPVESLEVEAGEELVLEPGGIHLMLLDVQRLEVGESVEVTLLWANAGEVTVMAEVVAPDDVMGHEDHDG